MWEKGNPGQLTTKPTGSRFAVRIETHIAGFQAASRFLRLQSPSTNVSLSKDDPNDAYDHLVERHPVFTFLEVLGIS
ncbi:hypothetical protein ACFX11_036824 [Malus domestica]